MGFPCPVDAKNGSDVTVLPEAVELGAHLVAGAQVTRIDDDGNVTVVAGDGHRLIRAGRIALGAGAIETARLLQVSGLGNDWVGDCLQGHTYSGAFGRFDDVVLDGLGPGPSVATRQFSHGNDGVVGGGNLANEFVKLPGFFWLLGLPPDAPRTGDAAIEEVVHWYSRDQPGVGTCARGAHPGSEGATVHGNRRRRRRAGGQARGSTAPRGHAHRGAARGPGRRSGCTRPARSGRGASSRPSPPCPGGSTRLEPRACPSRRPEGRPMCTAGCGAPSVSTSSTRACTSPTAAPTRC